MKRRQFLKSSAYALAGLALRPAWLQAAAPAETPEVVVAQGSAQSATRAAVEALGGIRRFVSKGQKVVVKPNMSFANPPSWATTTDPEVVRELVSMCTEAEARQVLVLDHPLRDTEMCLERSGIAKACQVFEETLVMGLKDKRLFTQVEVPEGRELKTTFMMKDVLDADVLISVPVAKSHGAAGVSLSMKNMMGVIYDRAVFHWKLDLHTAIVDLCTVARPHLTVVDAIRLLSTAGPGGPGKVLRFDTIIASTDMVAADAYAVSMGEWYGRKFQPEQVRHIREAHERGLGRMDVERFSIKRVSM